MSLAFLFSWMAGVAVADGGVCDGAGALPVGESYAVTADAVVQPGLLGTGDLFGDSMAVGDFNGDGVSDLAIGAPGADHLGPAWPDAGQVSIYFGAVGFAPECVGSNTGCAQPTLFDQEPDRVIWGGGGRESSARHPCATPGT